MATDYYYYYFYFYFYYDDDDDDDDDDDADADADAANADARRRIIAHRRRRPHRRHRGDALRASARRAMGRPVRSVAARGRPPVRLPSHDPYYFD